MKITGIHLVKKPNVWPTGDRVVAFFDVDFSCFELRDCMLIHTARGFPLAQAPRGESSRGTGRFIRITDDRIRRAMTAAAYEAYLAIGGAKIENPEPVS
jgi:hypothetical protein